MALDETRTAGETGHLSDHNSLHDLYNAAVDAGEFDETTGTWNGSYTVAWLNPEELQAQNGAPARSQRASHPVWLLDAAASEDVGGTLVIPAGWTTVNVKLYWTNPSTGTGDVSWRLFHNAFSDGESLGSTAEASVVATAPTQDVVEVTTVGSGLAVTAGDPFLTYIRRSGADAADTLANDAALLGVLIEKAS